MCADALPQRCGVTGGSRWCPTIRVAGANRPTQPAAAADPRGGGCDLPVPLWTQLRRAPAAMWIFAVAFGASLMTQIVFHEDWKGFKVAPTAEELSRFIEEQLDRSEARERTKQRVAKNEHLWDAALRATVMPPADKRRFYDPTPAGGVRWSHCRAAPTRLGGGTDPRDNTNRRRDEHRIDDATRLAGRWSLAIVLIEPRQHPWLRGSLHNLAHVYGGRDRPWGCSDDDQPREVPPATTGDGEARPPTVDERPPRRVALPNVASEHATDSGAAPRLREANESSSPRTAAGGHHRPVARFLTSLTIFHSADNLESLRGDILSPTAGWRGVQYRLLPARYGWHRSNAMLTSAWWYQQVGRLARRSDRRTDDTVAPAAAAEGPDFVMTFQTDALVRWELDVTWLMPRTSYLYVGPPWRSPPGWGCSRFVGNGGVSLRHVASFAALAAVSGPASASFAEDVWWCRELEGLRAACDDQRWGGGCPWKTKVLLRAVGAKEEGPFVPAHVLPSPRAAGRFAAEQVWFDEAAAVHALIREHYEPGDVEKVLHGGIPGLVPRR